MSIQRKRVLIVDDEPVMLRSLARVLARQYEVLLANNVDDALLTLSEVPGGVFAIVTDFDMPRLTGADLAKSVKSRYPDLRVVLHSGNSGSGTIDEHLFDHVTLKGNIEQLLEALER